jgi:hypothetical protein
MNHSSDNNEDRGSWIEPSSWKSKTTATTTASSHPSIDEKSNVVTGVDANVSAIAMAMTRRVCWDLCSPVTVKCVPKTSLRIRFYYK